MTNEEFDLCMSRIRNGDKESLHKIYQAYIDYLFHQILSIVGNYEDAEDITSELFIRIWKEASRYTPGGGHKRWLSTIAHNMAVDHLRANKREIPAEDMEEALENDPSARAQDISEEVISDMTVEQILSKLKPAEREIVHLKIIGEQTFEKIAAIMQMPLGTVTWKYRQAMDRLRRYGYEA